MDFVRSIIVLNSDNIYFTVEVSGWQCSFDEYSRVVH